jgi:asparagine synthase (glutamine-hydrolysing)
MCGIFGIISEQKCTIIDAAEVLRCVDTMTHRGPDAYGIVSGSGFCFGHRRLSIIDLDDRSNQPFQDPTRQVTLTYNGEIFNFKQLKYELERKGICFQTDSDTEVLLYCYLVWGIDCLSKLNGIFAFAIHDARSGETFLVRDRMGVKPLYYYQHRNFFLFASEPEAILRYPGVYRKLDLQGVSSFLSYRSVIGEKSLYAGVKKILPGQYLKLKENKIIAKEYWNIDLSVSSTTTSVEEIKSLIENAVSLQLEADVPIAVFLSGGIDSSIIAYEAQSHSVNSLSSYTARIAVDGFDESSFAHEIVNHLNLYHHTMVDIDIGKYNDFNLISNLIGMRKHPLGMHNELAQYLLAIKASSENKVVLTGEGADEIFAGYSRLFRMPFDYHRGKFRFKASYPLRKNLLEYVSNAESYSERLLFFLSRYTYFPTEEKMNLIRPHICHEIENDRYLLDLFAKYFSESAHLSFFDCISYIMAKVHLPALLEMVDGTTMASGLEARVPFTDHRIVQAAFHLPESMKLRWRNGASFLYACLNPVSKFSEKADISKFVLRQAYRNDLPKTTLTRPKMGFPIPLKHWAIESSEEFRNLVFSSDARVSDFFDPDTLVNWYELNSRMPTEEFGKRVWLILNLELFLQRFFP